MFYFKTATFSQYNLPLTQQFLKSVFAQGLCTYYQCLRFLKTDEYFLPLGIYLKVFTRTLLQIGNLLYEKE